MTTTTTLPAQFHADFCDSHDHPDNHCVQKNQVIEDVFNSRTGIAAFLNRATQEVGVYHDAQILRPDDARAMAAALIASADAAERALDALERTGR